VQIHTSNSKLVCVLLGKEYWFYIGGQSRRSISAGDWLHWSV